MRKNLDTMDTNRVPSPTAASLRPAAPAAGEGTAWRRRAWALVGALAALGVLLACGFADNAGQWADQNTYWSCPSATPWPTPSPVPTRCRALPTGTPNAQGTPGPGGEDCTSPLPTATPLPSATPYGRQVLPGGRQSSQNIFYRDQDVRWGPLRVTYRGPQAGALQPGGLQVWLFHFDAASEAVTGTLQVAWPARLVVREVTRADGTTVQDTWQATTHQDATYQAAGLAPWQDSEGALAPGQQGSITVPILLPVGTPVAVGFSLDPGITLPATPSAATPPAGDPAQEVAGLSQFAWFVDGVDPYCGGNTSGPVRPDQGGAVYQQALSPTPTGSYSLFSGWPMAGASSEITQPFGCTKFPEATGYPCPAGGQPVDWTRFHKGVDFGLAEGTIVRSVSYGTVILVGDSRRAGYRSCDCAGRPGPCPWTGSEPPHYNLGYAVFVQSADKYILYGHLERDSSDPFGIAVGDAVQPGQALGLEGSTGCSSGPHLHLEIDGGQLYGPPLDPLNLIGPNRARRTP